jgi:hypothetical protein
LLALESAEANEAGNGGAAAGNGGAAAGNGGAAAAAPDTDGIDRMLSLVRLHHSSGLSHRTD